jgi:hypothetical protein
MPPEGTIPGGLLAVHHACLNRVIRDPSLPADPDAKSAMARKLI